MAVNEVKIKADKIKNTKKRYYIIRLILLLLVFFLIVFFIILGIIYKGGNFTITLDPSFSAEQNIVIYEDLEYKEAHPKLYADKLDYMDNISIKWIPENINNEKDGPHNGDNYIAYTFYVENMGQDIVNYWYEIKIDDVIKNVDEAIRIMIFRNDTQWIYAKKNNITNKEEKDTVMFYSDDSPVLEQRKTFKPGDIDKYTIVVWLEGDDPDCVNAIIGGEIKMHMELRNENFVEEE